MITLVPTLFCDGGESGHCHGRFVRKVWTSGDAALTEKTKELLRQDAKVKGWCHRGSKDFCPACK